MIRRLDEMIRRLDDSTTRLDDDSTTRRLDDDARRSLPSSTTGRFADDVSSGTRGRAMERRSYGDDEYSLGFPKIKYDTHFRTGTYKHSVYVLRTTT